MTVNYAIKWENDLWTFISNETLSIFLMEDYIIEAHREEVSQKFSLQNTGSRNEKTAFRAHNITFVDF